MWLSITTYIFKVLKKQNYNLNIKNSKIKTLINLKNIIMLIYLNLKIFLKKDLIFK